MEGNVWSWCYTAPGWSTVLLVTEPETCNARWETSEIGGTQRFGSAVDVTKPVTCNRGWEVPEVGVTQPVGSAFDVMQPINCNRQWETIWSWRHTARWQCCWLNEASSPAAMKESGSQVQIPIGFSGFLRLWKMFARLPRRTEEKANSSWLSFAWKLKRKDRNPKRNRKRRKGQKEYSLFQLARLCEENEPIRSINRF